MSDGDNKKRIALVTAASRGIGYACAETLARQGHAIEICSRDPNHINAAAEKIAESTGAQVHGHVCDVRDQAQNQQLVEKVIRQHGRIDILVFNSGSPPSGSFERATDEDWLEGHKLCMEPTIHFLRAVLPLMESQGWGRIIFINSIFGKEPDSGYTVSSTERAAQLALVKCVARLSADKGVTINAVLPGYVDTPLLREYAKIEAAFRQINTNDVLAEWAAMLPRKALATATEIGELVAWLASEGASNITGTAMQSDGGMMRGV